MQRDRRQRETSTSAELTVTGSPGNLMRRSGLTVAGWDTRYDVNQGGSRLPSKGLGFYPEGEGDSIIKSL